MRLLTVGIVALCLGGLILAQDDSKTDGKSRADRLKAIRDEGTKAMSEYRQALSGAKSDDDRKAAAAKYSSTMNTLRPKQIHEALELGKENPKDNVGFDALMMAFQMSAPNAPERAEAKKLLLENHLTSEKIETALPALARNGRSFDKDFLNEVKEKNPAKSVKAYASFVLAQASKAEAESAKTPDAQILPKFQEAQKAFEAVAQEFGDVEVRSLRGKVSAAVDREIAEIKKSPIGKPTPEIEGEDIDSKQFKISDYRGKVVLLDFWGHW